MLRLSNTDLERFVKGRRRRMQTPQTRTPVAQPGAEQHMGSNAAITEILSDDETDKKSEKSGGFFGIDLGGLKNRFSVQPTEEERESLSEIQQYLTPPGLSGEDGVFNHGDTDALVGHERHQGPTKDSATFR